MSTVKPRKPLPTKTTGDLRIETDGKDAHQTKATADVKPMRELPTAQGEYSTETEPHFASNPKDNHG